MPTVSIRFDSQFLETAFARYRRQSRSRLLIAGAKIPTALFFGAAAHLLSL